METTTIQIDKEDTKKLDDFKLHRNEPYWETIKKCIMATEHYIKEGGDLNE